MIGVDGVQTKCLIWQESEMQTWSINMLWMMRMRSAHVTLACQWVYLDYLPNS